MFSGGKKKPAAPARQGKSGQASLSFIGTDILVSGDISGSAQIHIDGRIDGNVRCDALIQGEGGIIAGHIEAQSAHLSGLVDGTVKARVVTLEPSARITGDVTYETLSIAAGATIEGRLAHREKLGAPEPALPAPRRDSPAERKRPASTGRFEEPSLLPAEIAPAAAR